MTMKKKTITKQGRPYKLSIDQHRELHRRKRAGEVVLELAMFFGVGAHTIYEYLKLDPEQRTHR